MNLVFFEVKVYMDSEILDLNEVEIKKLLAINFLVEEFMLLVNILVVRKIYDVFF